MNGTVIQAGEGRGFFIEVQGQCMEARIHEIKDERNAEK